MATNEILRFAETDTGTNLLTQVEYAADSQRPIGNQPGVARSKLVNKALRQSSLLAAGLAEFLADNQSNDITDGLTPQNIADYLLAAMQGGLGVTAPQFDNDTSLATTAFVQRALGNKQGVTSISTTTTITAGGAGKVFNCFGVGSYTITLPDTSGLPDGAEFLFVSGSPSITVSKQGSDLIYFPGGSTSSTLVLNTGDTAILQKVGTNTWLLTGGSAVLKYAGNFAASLSGNGYQKLPSGLIIQWGVTSSSVSPGGSFTITLPIAMPNNIVSAVASLESSVNGTTGNAAVTNRIGTTQIIIRNFGTSIALQSSWIAIGY